MRKLIKYVLGLANLEIRRKVIVHHHYNDEMRLGLQRLMNLHLEFGTIIDVGSAAGLWSMSAKQFWPEAYFVLFEPLLERKDSLLKIVNEHRKFFFIPAAAGKETSTINFSVTDDLDGSFVSSNESDKSRIVDVVSIGDEVGKLNLPGPYLIKLDTHGFEVPIIEGCELIIDNVSVFIIECYGFNITSESLLFWEMCRKMDVLGFRLWDIVDIMHRPIDNSFWQCDAFFLRKENSVFSNNKYK